MRAIVALGVALVLLVVAEGSTMAIPSSLVASYEGPLRAVRLPIADNPVPARSESVRTPDQAPEASLSVIHDFESPPVPTNARRAQPQPQRGVVVKAVAPVRYRARTSHVLRGAASWYCNRNGSRGPISSCHNAYPDTGGFDAYAAAGPRLRAALGDWRGRVVSVDGLRVKLVDWCQCYQGQSNEKLIDLYLDVYRAVGGSVTIRW